MNRFNKTLSIVLVLTGMHTAASAQVKFKINRTDADTYVVSMVPQQSLTARQSITGTMQVTLKSLAANGFVPGSITSLQPEVEWDRGTLNKSPDGARDYDYFSVALRTMGTKAFVYESGKDIPLFSVKNAGQPTADLALIDNTTDPIIKSKHNVFNVSNHISVLGFGQRNAYSGNIRSDVLGGSQVGLRQVFPNPARERTTVEFVNYLKALEGEVTLQLAETGSGRLVISQKEQMNVGVNQAEIAVGTLTAGSYILYLDRQGKRLGKSLKLIIVH